VVELVGGERQAIDHLKLRQKGGAAEGWRLIVKESPDETHDDRVYVGNPNLEALLRDGMGGVVGGLGVGFEDVDELAVEGLLAKLGHAIVGGEDLVEANVGVYQLLMLKGSATGDVELLTVGYGFVVAGLFGG